MKFLLLIAFFPFTNAFSQWDPDTLFYNAGGNVTAHSDSIVFYCLHRDDGTFYYVSQHYAKTDIVQMTGAFVSSDKTIRHGYFKWYTAEGYLQSEGEYKANLRQGTWKYYKDKKLYLTQDYVDGMINGVVTEYDANEHVISQRVYGTNNSDKLDSYETNLRTGFLIRGKAAGFVIIEDAWVFNFTAGVEYRFAPNHAIGVDYYYFRFRNEQEQYADTTYTDYNEYSQYNPRSSLLIDYRIYFDGSISKKRWIQPYFQAYYRFGKARTYHQEQYKIDSSEMIRQWEKFYDIGLTFGIHYAFFPEGRFGFDICGGAYRRSKIEDVEHYEPGGPNWFEYDVKRIQWFPILRINLFYYLWGRKTKSVLDN